MPKSEFLLEHPSFRNLSAEEMNRAASFLVRVIEKTNGTGTEAEFLRQVLELTVSELGAGGCFLAGDHFLIDVIAASESAKHRERHVTVRCFLENLILSGIDSISQEILESLPEMDSEPVSLVRSSSHVTERILLLVFAAPRSFAMPVLIVLEPWVRIRLQAFRSKKSLERLQSWLDGIHQGSRLMIGNLLNQSQLIPSLMEGALRIMNSVACAILLPKDETRKEYTVTAQVGFPENQLPIPEALFSKAFVDYDSNNQKAVRYQARNNQSYLLVPLIQRKMVRGVLLLLSNDSGGEEWQNAAGIIGDLFSLANENTTLFQRFATSQTEWENTFDSIADPIYIIDNEYKLKKMNKSLASYSMKSIKVPLDPYCYRYLFNQNSVCPWCPVPKSLETGAPEIVESPLFSTGVWQIQAFPYTDKEEHRLGSINVLRDITLLNRMQEQLIETEKLASAGKLISGVAHEVRNPLFGISATARALANELKGAPQDIQPYLDIITSETSRLNRLMEDLLNYTRPVRIDKNPSDINDLVQEVIEHFQHLPEGQNAQFNMITGDRIPPMNMDRNKMKQVLFNLFENGIQHANEEPRVDIFLQFLSLADPPEIHLVVKDNGIGISNENLTKVFDPFFTTRQKGTGLGLSIVRKVVHDHGGRISVESHPGIGTTFRITLPLSGARK
jgi:two-component system NtrC family sensor kinase